MKHTLLIITALMLVVGCSKEPKKVPEKAPTTTKPALESVKEAIGERNARWDAAEYLKMSAFSRSGLIEQLEYEGFTTTQAEYGANAVGY